MQTIKYFLLLSILAFSFSSCENFFETTLELDPPPFEKKLVLIANLKTGTEVFQVFVTENFGILDDEQIPTLTDPKIEFTINGQLYDNYSRAKADNGFIFYFPFSNVSLQPGDVCRMMVSHEGFPIATSAQIVPPKVELTNIKYVENGGLDTEGSEKSKVDVSFSDPSGKNFYETVIKSNNPMSWYNYYYTSLNEPGASDGLNYYDVIFNDLAFEGKQKDLSLLIDRTFENQAREFEIAVVWRSVTEDYYKYVRTANVYYDNNDNPFTTPADVYSNVDGGLGIFYIINETEYPIF
jgi:hypothetical protein